MTIDSWLKDVSNELADAMIPSARLDAEIILAHTLNKPRTWLHAHGDEEIDPRRKDIADARAELRLERVPVAYIIGHKEFFGRRFMVSPDVLIPRPESEQLISAIKQIYQDLPNKNVRLVDVGTGSGCLGISAKLECPQLEVWLSDVSKNALLVAEKNATQLNADVHVIESDLLAEVSIPVNILIANLPYVDRSWQVSVDTKHEPQLALYADSNGLALIEQLLSQIPTKLESDGYVVLEADRRQHDEIVQKALKHQLQLVANEGFCLVLQKQ